MYYCRNLWFRQWKDSVDCALKPWNNFVSTIASLLCSQIEIMPTAEQLWWNFKKVKTLLKLLEQSRSKNYSSYFCWCLFSLNLEVCLSCFKFLRQVVMFDSYICHILDPVVGSCLKPKARCHGWVLMLGFLEYGTECWMLPLITQTGIYNKNIKLPSDVVNNLFEVFWLFFNSRG